MNDARAFALAGAVKMFREQVLGAAHATANAMVEGTSRKTRLKQQIADTGDALEHYQALVLSVYPAALEYRPDMTAADVHAWAARMLEALK